MNVVIQYLMIYNIVQVYFLEVGLFKSYTAGQRDLLSFVQF